MNGWMNEWMDGWEEGNRIMPLGETIFFTPPRGSEKITDAAWVKRTGIPSLFTN